MWTSNKFKEITKTAGLDPRGFIFRCRNGLRHTLMGERTMCKAAISLFHAFKKLIYALFNECFFSLVFLRSGTEKSIDRKKVR